MTDFFFGIFISHLVINFIFFILSFSLSRILDNIQNQDDKIELDNKDNILLKKQNNKILKINILLLFIATIIGLTAIYSTINSKIVYIDNMINFITFIIFIVFIVLSIKHYSLLYPKYKNSFNETLNIKKCSDYILCYISSFIIIFSLLFHANLLFDFSKQEEQISNIISSDNYSTFNGKSRKHHYVLNIDPPFFDFFSIEVSPTLQQEAKKDDKIQLIKKNGFFGVRYIKVAKLIKNSNTENNN